MPGWKLRAALALARIRGDGSGTTWSAEEWERVLRHLTALQQRVIYKVLLLGLTHDQAGEAIGISRTSVRAAWVRAIGRLRLVADVVPVG